MCIARFETVRKGGDIIVNNVPMSDIKEGYPTMSTIPWYLWCYLAPHPHPGEQTDACENISHYLPTVCGRQLWSVENVRILLAWYRNAQFSKQGSLWHWKTGKYEKFFQSLKSQRILKICQKVIEKSGRFSTSREKKSENITENSNISVI